MPTDSAILDELVSPLGRCLTPEVAARVVNLRATSQLDARIQELGQKCGRGELSSDELSDYETITRYIKFISVLQSKARKVLNDNTTM